MLRTILLLTAVFAPVSDASTGDALRVVTTIPDLADIVSRVGGDRVDVKALTRGTENAHAVPLRPSALVAVGRAELFFEMGLSLEHAWVPGLLQAANNSRIRPGSETFVNCSTGFPVLQVPTRIDRSAAVDLHPEGNPHWNLSPRAGRHVADLALEVLVKRDPDGEDEFVANHGAYLEELEVAQERWATLAERLAGKQIVTYHQDLTYFAADTGLEVVGTVEKLPGVPPTPKHLSELAATMREAGVTVIVCASWAPSRNVAKVAKEAGAQVVHVPLMVGGSPRARTWIELVDELHERIADAVAPLPDPDPEPGRTAGP